MNLGELIKEARLKKGLTTTQLANKVDLTQGYISHLENNRKKNPSIEVLNKLAKGLDIPNGNLLMAAGFIDDPFNQFIVTNEKTGELEIQDNKDLKSKNEIELPTHISIKDNKGIETTKQTELDDAFDLFYLLQMDVDIRFNRHQLENEPPLTEEEKKEILDFAGYLISKREKKK